MVIVSAALSQETTLQPAATEAMQKPQVDARSALFSAIALGYTEIRAAEPVGDPYQVETAGAEGNIVRLNMEPQSFIVVKITAE